MAATENITVTNTAAGPRGIHAVDGYHELEPGASKAVELVEAEFLSAQEAGYFSFDKPGKAPAAPKAPSPPDNDGNGGAGGSLPNNPLQLKALARAEEIDVGNATKAADLKAAIVAGRQAKAAAAQAAGGGAPQSDDLDALADDVLLTTTAAITGKPEADLAGKSRDELLALARGNTGE